MTTDLDLTGLRGDGDTIELPDGRELRLTIAPDDCSTPDDWGDWYGNLSRFIEYRDTGGSIYPRPRPDDFDGAARKINLRDGFVWWQPPADVTDRDALRAMKANLTNLYEYGTSVFILELRSECDCCHRVKVDESAVLGGVEPFPDDDYRREILSDLVAELGI